MRSTVVDDLEEIFEEYKSWIKNRGEGVNLRVGDLGGAYLKGASYRAEHISPIKMGEACLKSKER